MTFLLHEIFLIHQNTFYNDSCNLHMIIFYGIFSYDCIVSSQCFGSVPKDIYWGWCQVSVQDTNLFQFYHVFLQLKIVHAEMFGPFTVAPMKGNCNAAIVIMS